MLKTHNDDSFDHIETSSWFEHKWKKYFIEAIPDPNNKWYITPWRVYITDEVGIVIFESRSNEDWKFWFPYYIWHTNHDFSDEDLTILQSKINDNFADKINHTTDQIYDTIK